MNLADILKLAGLTQQEPMSSLSSPGSSCNQHMNPDDMRTLVVKIEQPQLQPEQEMVATEEAEGSYANAPEEKEVGDTHNDFSFKGFGKRKRHTRDALGNYGDNPLEESKMFTEYTTFKEQELNEFWDEAGNWFKGKGYKSDEELAADEKGSGERSFKFKKGDSAKGTAINAKKAAIARTRASEFGSTMSDPRAHASEFGGSMPQANQVARPKPQVKHASEFSGSMPKATPVARPKPPTSAGAGSTLRGLDTGKGSKQVARSKPLQKNPHRGPTQFKSPS